MIIRYVSKDRPLMYMDIKYIIYARKSSESSERQVQSINDQITSLKRLAGSLNLTIVKTYSESKSAKSPNLRPKFNDMVEEIMQGKATGILCWQINRLSRNPPGKRSNTAITSR